MQGLKKNRRCDDRSNKEHVNERDCSRLQKHGNTLSDTLHYRTEKLNLKFLCTQSIINVEMYFAPTHNLINVE